jgi:hypothetical protein
MRRLELPWRFLFPGIVFPASVVLWVQYQMSVRASDDSPVPWHWFGSPISAALNFPAFVYSGPAVWLYRMGVPAFTVGRLWIDPQVVAFFLLIIVHWYWIGRKIEYWGEPKPNPSKAGHALIALYGVGAAFWLLWVVGSVQAVVRMWPLALSPLLWRSDLYVLIPLLWSVGLSAYYSTSFVRSLRLRAKQ